MNKDQPIRSLRLFFEYVDERTDTEAVWKGWRPDVYVEIEGSLYHLIANDPHRFLQDFNSEVDEKGFYTSEPCLFFVTECSMSVIRSTVLYLAGLGYFAQLVVMSDEERAEVESELQEFEGADIQDKSGEMQS